MRTIPLKDPRRIIPRWRDFNNTLGSGECTSVGYQPVSPVRVDPLFYDEKMNAWLRSPGVAEASEFLETAFVFGRIEEAEDALKKVLTHESSVLPVIFQLAEHIANIEPNDVTAGQENETPVGQLARLRVNVLRADLKEWPKNPFHWVDLARAYAALGYLSKAIRAAEVAMALAPKNRWVIRSCARLFVHCDEPDRANDISRKALEIRVDPWILACEIATATVAERKQKHITKARKILTHSKASPIHLSELAGAMATIELLAGSERAAKKLFARSLIDPTDNSIAQAAWAQTRVGSLTIPDRALSQPYTFEANARRAAKSGEWDSTLANCRKWFFDEPFSLLPTIMGSYYAAVGCENFVEAETFARNGLIPNPGDLTLQNNLVVSLASQGRVNEARKEFDRIDFKNASDAEEIALTATEGLLAFRGGHIEEGRKLYKNAIKQASEKKDRMSEALAAVHLMKEEIFIAPEAATALEPFVTRLVKATNEPALQSMLLNCGLKLNIEGISSDLEPEKVVETTNKKSF